MVDTSRSPELCRAVQQLVSRVASSLPQTRVASVEDVLGHLETTDENFHNYELVRHIQQKIEAAIGPLVDRRLESGMYGEEEGHDLVAQITEEIFTSPEYSILCQSLVADVKLSVEELLEDEALSEALMAELNLSSGRTSSSTQYASVGDSLTSDLSGSNQPREMFIPQQQLLSLTEKLHSSQPASTREHAVHQLLHYPAGDLPHCEHWAQLRAALKTCLLDDTSPLVDLTLKLLALMFHSSYSAIGAHEAHSILTDALITRFKMSPPPYMLLETGVSCQNHHHRNLLLQFRLLNLIHNDVPSYWVRYSERVVEDMIESTFSLLELTYSGYSRTSHYIGPLHFVAVLDSLASWFKKWMHGRYSRMKVLQELARRQIFMEGILQFLVSYQSVATAAVCTPPTGHTFSEYGQSELNYLHFVHLITILERLLLYERGRKLITSAISGFHAISTIQALLVHLLHQLYSLPYNKLNAGNQSTVTELHGSHMFAPTTVIVKLFKEIACSNTNCAELLCDLFIDAAIQPLQESLKGKSSLQCEDALVNMADVIAILASTHVGRSCLLYGTAHNTTGNLSLAAVHTIAQFVVHHLKLDSVPSRVVCSWLFVCRQSYNTAEGLLVLMSYSLHQHIARALLRCGQKNKPQSQTEVGVVGKGVVSVTDEWKEKLIDNLLNFAGTPKGVLLLYQSGLMERCVQFMHHRYKLKLQVSHCERFGYGYMVTQVSSTAIGTSYLIASGYVTMLINDIWTLLDGGVDDQRLTTPRPHPFDPADRIMHKAVINLLNIVNLFPSLYEVLQQSSSSSSSQKPPTTLFDLLDRIVLTNSPNKFSHLISFEEAHHCGLCILRLLVTCLDSFLYLECKYQLCNVLLALQAEYRLDNGKYIIDECSVARNSLLVSTYFMGGAGECTRPPYYISEASDECTWPLFSTLPPPHVYHVTATSSNSSTCSSSSSSLTAILSASLPIKKETSVLWMGRLREAYHYEVTTHGHLADSEVAMLLRCCVTVLLQIPDEAVFPPHSDVIDDPLSLPSPLVSHMDDLGVQLVSRYSDTLCIDSEGSTGMVLLLPLLQKTRLLCSAQQHKCHHHDNQAIYTVQDDYIGFDWFTAVVFLIMCQSHDITWQFMKDFSQLLVSGYLWMPRLHLSSHIPVELCYSGIHPIISVTSHYVELILHEEVPLVYSAFRLSGYAPAQVCQQWLRQCFLNYLNWPEIKLYLATCVVMGTDYQVYMCVAVLKYLKEEVIKMAQSQQLLVFLKEEQLSGFHVSEWLDYMKELQDKYRELVLPDMQALGRV